MGTARSSEATKCFSATHKALMSNDECDESLIKFYGIRSNFAIFSELVATEIETSAHTSTSNVDMS